MVSGGIPNFRQNIRPETKYRIKYPVGYKLSGTGYQDKYSADYRTSVISEIYIYKYSGGIEKQRHCKRTFFVQEKMLRNLLDQKSN